MLHYVYVSHRRRKHGGHSSHAKESTGAWPLCRVRQYKIYIFTHSATYTYINLNLNQVLLVQMIIKSGTDFDGEKQEAASLDSRRLNYFAKPKV